MNNEGAEESSEPAALEMAGDGASGSDQPTIASPEEQAPEGTDGADDSAAAQSEGSADPESVASDGPVAPDGSPDTDGVPGSPGPDPDSIATTAMLAAGAAYFRATRLGEEVADGIDFGWLIDDRKNEIVDRRASAERAVIALAEFCRKVPGASAGTLVMQLQLSRYRASAETTPEEHVAFNVFAWTLHQLDWLAKIRAAEAREKHKKIPKPAAIDIEETTLALVDEPMALTEIGMRSR
ncbi:hypothetical protein D5400_11675 [Georhizobium profundi]|uniref:Uncharacterized protein n=1 Tax=Georhizobium profundi TaxID=2341112 RepID=A0A3S9B4J5_9HYPH|nr:hypothetical protein D5400_11675 [Georhizobium profundi]